MIKLIVTLIVFLIGLIITKQEVKEEQGVKEERKEKQEKEGNKQDCFYLYPQIHTTRQYTGYIRRPCTPIHPKPNLVREYKEWKQSLNEYERLRKVFVR